MKKLKGESFKTTQLEIGCGIKLMVWSRVPLERKPTPQDIGKRVWIAGNTSTIKTTLLEVHQKGERYWPRFGGFTVSSENGWTKELHHRALRLHPENFVKKRKKRTPTR